MSAQDTDAIVYLSYPDSIINYRDITSMRLVFLSLLPLVVTACGGDDSSSSDPFSGIERYSLNPYVGASESLQNDSYEGTWVGVVEVTQERYNMVNAEVPETRAVSSLTSMVIRERSNGTGLEVANCSGNFEDLSLTTAGVQSSFITADKNSANTLTYGISGSRYVPLSFVSGYDEDYSVEATFQRVSDTVAAMGTMTFNWSDTDGQSTSDVYCITVENYPDNQKRAIYSGENDSIISLADFTAYPQYDVYVAQDEHEGVVSGVLDTGTRNFSFSEETDTSFSMTYSAERLDGLSVSGEASATIPVQ